jgi:hypothetical protein
VCCARVRRRIVLGFGALVTVVCAATAGAAAQDRHPLSAPAQDGLVRLPVADGRDIRFIPFSLNGDAPRSRIRAIAQDDYGFLWLGTTNGLYRYDGYSLEHYLHEPGNPASLSGDRVFTVYKDRGGTLWIGTPAGLDRLDPTGHGFTHYRHDPADDRSLSGPAYVVHQDEAGTLWVGTTSGLDRMDSNAVHPLSARSPRQRDPEPQHDSRVA